MSSCPKCFHNIYIKSGKTRGLQRYKCKSCSYYYTVSQRSGTSSKEVRRQALQLYLEGMGFRAIGRILKFSHVAVYNWIKEFGEQLQELKSDDKISIVEIDEMHSYVGNKKIIAGSGLLLIEIGKNSSISLLAREIQKQERSSGIN